MRKNCVLIVVSLIVIYLVECDGSIDLYDDIITSSYARSNYEDEVNVIETLERLRMKVIWGG